MAKKKRAEAKGGESGQTAAPPLPPGVKLLQTLQGHSNGIISIAFDPIGRMLASASADNTVKLWEASSGKLLRTLNGPIGFFGVAFDSKGSAIASGSEDHTVKVWDATSGKVLYSLEGHRASVHSVTFSSTADTVASGGHDSTIKLWEVTKGELLRTLEGHEEDVFSVVFDSEGRLLASGSNDQTVKLWDPTSGELVRTLEGHHHGIFCVAFDRDGRTVASGSWDQTVKLWDVTSGKLLRTLEGHTAPVDVVAFSYDGQLLASKSRDGTIRVWRCNTWETVAVLAEATKPEWWIPALAFHPTLPRLATAGSDLATPEHQRCRLIHVWELDLDVLLADRRTSFQIGKPRSKRHVEHMPEADGQGSTPTVRTVQYTNAKAVFVGDTGVGKSTLAQRLVRNQFVQSKPTHARRTLLLDSQSVPTPQGRQMHRETVLWDLAGQPAYRLVHQLSLDNAAVACVLFDARSETNPFEGAAYWAQVLKQAKTNIKPTKFLIASRVDVGGLPASPQRIEAFAREHGFDQVFQTSAYTGEGCAELLAALREAIPWEDLPAVSSSETLAELREFVSRLKGEFPSDTADESDLPLPSLMTIAELQGRFEADTGKKLPLMDLLGYLQRLEDCDVLDLLIFHSTGQSPRPEDQVLLDPTRVDAYASALLVAAKDEPDGPGHLLESRVRGGNFKLEQSERLNEKASEKHVLWYVMENLLARDLALREQIHGQDYVVFPAQCTSPLVFPGGTAFGVALGMAGPVRSIYATLIAQLAHYEGFTEREFFQDAAAYHSSTGRCLVRLLDKGDGTGELQVSFDEKTTPDVRQGFLEFVGKHVEAKAAGGSFTRRHAYHCHSCSKPFADDLVRERLVDRRPDLLCPRCESRTPLVNLLAPPTPASIQVAATIDANAKAGRQRITAEWIIKAKEAEGKYDVFLSHNSKDKDAVEQIARRLMKVGIRPWLDKWDLIPGETWRRWRKRSRRSSAQCCSSVPPTLASGT